ncbi:MAG: hypothetical protein DRQ51_00905 [Gammaproteobacteria bacterium]|nr:MAG: hypothetical protein DRQ51_00905 [Gammaproteobacteria bacterium]
MSIKIKGIGILKKSVVIMYDTLIVVALLLVTTMVASFIPIIPDKGIFFQVFLFLVLLFYFIWFWHYGGQTTGMLAWKVHLISFDGKKPTLKQLIIRFMASILCWLSLGAGFLYSIFNKNNLALNDILSKTILEKKNEQQ